MKEMLDFETFKKEIIALQTVYSIKDKIRYDIIDATDAYLTILRRSTMNQAKIKFEELYDFYIHETEYNTTKAKQYKLSRAQSPSVALLRALTSKS